jgi:hypothetical protein
MALLALPAGAAAKAGIPTTVSLDDVTLVGSQVEMIGHLTSSNRKCLGGRTVKIFITYVNHGRLLVDTDVTSVNGSWAGSGRDQGAASARVEVLRKTFGRRGHRRTCAAASTTFTFS